MMRQNVFDEYGDVVGWFKLNAATRYEEGTRWDGSNHISLATGSQWDHEALYKTKGGQWVKNWWSQYQGTCERWNYITEEDAKTWMIQNEYECDDIERLFGEKLPEETGPGRPAVGKTYSVKIEDAVIERIDQLATERDSSRSAIIREAINLFLMRRV